MAAASQETGADPLIGVLLGGRYRVERVLGEGGAGIVYEATHEELGRTVAIKVLGAAWAYDPAAVERFQREARASSSIGHRHIVDVYDLGRLDDGRPYLVMERLHGEPLDSVIERDGRVTIDRAVEIVEQAASALDAVHKKGIVHRDIKPENFFLAHPHADPEAVPEVKLLDFGLAAIATPSAGQSRLTRQGTVHGTPHYMAPEATGDDLPDHRADIYSLGVVMYELITGSVPFDSPNPLRILTLKHEQDAPTLQQATGESWPDDLEDVFAIVLCRDPYMRFASAGQFAQELKRASRTITGTHPIKSARPPHAAPAVETPVETAVTRAVSTALTLTPPPVRRAPIWIALSSLAVLASGVGAWAVLGGGGEPEAIEAPATAEAAGPIDEPAPAASEPSEETAAGASAPGAAETTAAAAPGEQDAPAGEAAATEAASARSAPAAGEAASGHRARAAAGARERRRRPTGATESAAAPAAAMVEEAPPVPRARPEEPGPALADTDRARAVSLTREGTTAMLQGRIPEAIRLFRDATLANPRHAPAWRGLGLANERLGRRPEAARAYERYLTFAPNAPDAAEVRRRLGDLR